MRILPEEPTRAVHSAAAITDRCQAPAGMRHNEASIEAGLRTCLGSSVFQVEAPGLKMGALPSRSGGCSLGSGPDAALSSAAASPTAEAAPAAEALAAVLPAALPLAFAASCASASALRAAALLPPPPPSKACAMQPLLGMSCSPHESDPAEEAMADDAAHILEENIQAEQCRTHSSITSLLSMSRGDEA